MPLINDDLRIQRTPYGDSAYVELPDLIGKMKDMMQLENWKTMLDTVPVKDWPAYIEKADQRTTDRLFLPQKVVIYHRYYSTPWGTKCQENRDATASLQT